MKTEKDNKKIREKILAAIMPACAAVCVVSIVVSSVLQYKSYKMLTQLSNQAVETSSLSLQNQQSNGSFVLITEKDSVSEAVSTGSIQNETTVAQTKNEITSETKMSTKAAEKSTQIDSVLVVNTNTKKIHSSTCSYAEKMTGANRKEISSEELRSYLDNGYTICSKCQACK